MGFQCRPQVGIGMGRNRGSVNGLEGRRIGSPIKGFQGGKGGIKSCKVVGHGFYPRREENDSVSWSGSGRKFQRIQGSRRARSTSRFASSSPVNDCDALSQVSDRSSR